MSFDFGARPQRMTLVNMVTGEARTPMFNPEQLQETIGVTFASQQVVGLSHQIQQFINTENVKYEFELFYHCLDGSGPSGLDAIQADRRFLKALTHPTTSQTILQGGTPRVLFIWPNLLSLTCYFKNLVFTYTKFNLSGAPTAWRAKIQLDEVRDVFVSSDDIQNMGDLRSPSPAFDDGGPGRDG